MAKSPLDPNLEPIVAIAAGVLIILKPKLLNYVIAGYLLYTGIAGWARTH